MHRRLVVVALVALCSALAAPASAAPRAAVPPTPDDFFGVMVDGPMLAPGFDWNAEGRLIRAAGVRTTRMALNWFEVAPQATVRTWEEYDRRIGALAHQGIRVLPVLIRAPDWAARGDTSQNAAPEPQHFAAFVREAMTRYGRDGTFWRENPAIPYVPIRDWQLWNEPDHPGFWSLQPWPETFLPVLRAGARAVRQTDPKARIVAPGLTNKPWQSLFRLYEAGAKGLFDVVAIHPYRRTPGLVLRVIARTRKTMRRQDDERLPIMLTEMTWTSGLGHATLVGGFETTEVGQARRLRRMFELLARYRTTLGIDSAYWYTWMSEPIGEAHTWFYSGVRRLDRRGAVVDKPALRALRSTIGRLTRPR